MYQWLFFSIHKFRALGVHNIIGWNEHNPVIKMWINCSITNKTANAFLFIKIILTVIIQPNLGIRDYLTLIFLTINPEKRKENGNYEY